MNYWEGKYRMLHGYYEEVARALGFFPDFLAPDEFHPEVVARAKQYRKWVTDCSLDNPEEWDD